jgi:flagellar protein FlaF
MSPNPYENVNVYGRNQKAHAEATASSRETDAQALLTCAWRLDDAKKLMEGNPRSKENVKIYGEAIRTNQRIWTIFQIALSDTENPLPQNLKIILMNLSRYVDQTSFRAVGKYRPDLIDSLISINRTLAAGLSKKPAVDTPPPVDTRDIPLSLSTSA